MVDLFIYFKYPKTSIPETEKLIVTVGLERAKQYLQQKYGQQMKNTSSGTTTTTTTTSSSLRMNKEEEIVPNKCAQNTISGQNNSGSTTFSTFNGIFTFSLFFTFSIEFATNYVSRSSNDISFFFSLSPQHHCLCLFLHIVKVQMQTLLQRVVQQVVQQVVQRAVLLLV